MAEEPNQELSMDDILSSIRSVLMEDNAAQQADAQPQQQNENEKLSPAEENNVSAEEEESSLLSALPSIEKVEPLPEEIPISVDDLPGMKDDTDEIEDLNSEDEIFELSPSMMVADKDDEITLENPEATAEPEISEDDIMNLSNLASSLQESAQEEAIPTEKTEKKEVPDLHAPIAADVLSLDEKEQEEPDFSIDEALSESSGFQIEDLPSAPSEEISLQEENIPDAREDTISTFEIQEKSDSDIEQEEANKLEEIKAALPPLDFDLPKVDVDSDPIYEPESSTVTDIDASQLKESISGVESKQEAPIETEDKPFRAEEKVSEIEETPQDATDVSANIINNFAKLFAEKKNAQAEVLTEPETTAPQTAPIRNSSQSIAELVREAVVKQVTQQMDANFETYAKEAVAAQTQAWLDANLPAIVEAVVAKEIERVMAKVGS